MAWRISASAATLATTWAATEKPTLATASQSPLISCVALRGYPGPPTEPPRQAGRDCAQETRPLRAAARGPPGPERPQRQALRQAQRRPREARQG
eukprot:1772968-Rhodomonas_salina.3